jgi:beta-mannanase
MQIVKRIAVTATALVFSVISLSMVFMPARVNAVDTECGDVSAKLVPECGAWFGGYSGWRESEIRGRESQIGRQYDIVHFYKDWDDVFLNPVETTLANEGRHLYYNFENRYFEQGGGVCWSDVANGSQDAVIDAKANQITAFNQPLFVTFMHEPEDDLGACDPQNGVYGTAEEYADAFRRMHDRFVAAGATNAVWVWNMMGTSGSYNDYTTLWPGDGYVDWVAADRYNWACREGGEWRDFTQTNTSFYDWLTQNSAPGHDFASKPYMLGEYGTPEDPANPTRKGDWFRAMPMQAKAFPRLKAVVSFDRPDNSGTPCDFSVGTSADALAGYAAAGQDLYFKQQKVDATKPTTPSNLKAVQTAKRKTLLTWNASTDNVGVKHYRITRDGGWNIGTSTTTSYADSTLKTDGWHTYVIYAVDAAGNESVASPQVAIKLVP